MMRRREFNKKVGAAIAALLSPFPRLRLARAGGVTPVFSYPNGFAGSSTSILLGNASLQGSVIQLIANQGHQHAFAWYATKQSPTAFTTQFTFQPAGLGASVVLSGFTFCIQNTVSPPGLTGYVGTNYTGDANMCG